MKKVKMKKTLFILILVYMTQYIYAERVDYSESKYYIDSPLIKIVNGESEIDKSDIIIMDFDDTDGTYKIVRRFYNWWQATCQHVAHDEWIQYKVFKNGNPPENQGGMISYNQMPENTYDSNNHNWGEWFEAERLEATETVEGYIKYKRECKYHRGWWGTLGAHEPDYKTEVIPKMSITQTPSQTITPASGTIKFVPAHSEWINRPIEVRVYVNGNTTTQKIDSEVRSYSYTSYETDQITGETSSKTITSNTFWGFTQNWSIGNIGVIGINLNEPNTIKNDTTVKLTEDGIGKLSASLTGWTSGSKSWFAGSPTMGNWNSGNPISNTSEPTEKYSSTSGTYKIDTKRPSITYNSTGRVRFNDGWNGYFYHPDNRVYFAISDNLSGISKVSYRWHRDGEQGTPFELSITTEEGNHTEKTIEIPVHEDKIRTGDWYLNVHAVDRAGNSFTLSSNKIRIICELYDFRITGIEDPAWRSYFYNSDGTSKGVELRVGDFPIGDRPDMKNTHIKKGYSFYFKFNSRGLNSLAEDIDRVEIEPRFYHTYDPSKGSNQRIDLYYNMGSTYLIKVGSQRDTLKIQYNNSEIGSLSLLDKLPRHTKDQIEGEWSGAYFIPSESIAVVKDKEPHIESNQLKRGYIVVEFVIKGIKNDNVVFEYVNKNIQFDKWEEEGGKNANNSSFYKGDIIIFDNRYSKKDDYNVRVDR